MMNNKYKAFDNAEEVWFWFCNIVDNQANGLRSRTDFPGLPRICEISDIYVILKKMHFQDSISNRHLRVLYRWGHYQIPPYYDRRAKRSEIKLWEDAIRCFDNRLRLAGILE